MAGMATAMVTVMSMSSVVYELTKLMLFKTAEVGTNTAIALLRKSPVDSVGNVQFILMELDIEAKIKAVRSLLCSVEGGEVDVAQVRKDFIAVCISNVRQTMTDIEHVLHRIQDAMDAHARAWFASYRGLHVIEDLNLLQALCHVFDKRLNTLIQHLSVPNSWCNMETAVMAQHGLASQRILGELALPSDEVFGGATSDTDRLRSRLMAQRALRDADEDDDYAANHGDERRGGSGGTVVTTKTTTHAPQTTISFEDSAVIL